MSCKKMTKILYGNSEKSFLECEKNGFKKHLPARFPRECSHVYIITNHTAFLIQFEINLYLGVFQKADTALTEAARRFYIPY